MNILVVSSLTPGTTAVYLIEALKAAGCGVRVVSDIAHPLTDRVATGVLDLRRPERDGFEPDAVLFIEGGSRRLFPRGMEGLRCKSAWYAIDSHVHLDLHVATARLFDVSFVAQREFLDAFRPRTAHWLPLAADPALFPAGTRARDIDIAYVGSDDRSSYPERARLLDIIRARHANVLLGRAAPHEMGNIYSRAKIVFNKSVRNDVNMRYFEAMAAGAVLLTDKLRANGVAELFEPGVDFLEYEDERSLLELIDRVLSDDAAREALGEHARRTILARHTYRHRAQAILAALEAAPRSPPAGPHDYMPVFHLLRFPDGVLDAASSSLASIRHKGDTNWILALAAAGSATLAALLVWAYRLRYRLRYWKYSRRLRRTPPASTRRR
jgi:hypothetical protein